MKNCDKFFRDYKEGWSSTTINYSGYGYGRHCAGMIHIYGYAPDGSTFSYIVTYHRSLRIEKLLRSGEWWSIDEDVRSNYATNGHTTRVGINRANIAKCKRMADSHRAIEGEGKEAHDARVRLRNKY